MFLPFQIINDFFDFLDTKELSDHARHEKGLRRRMTIILFFLMIAGLVLNIIDTVSQILSMDILASFGPVLGFLPLIGAVSVLFLSTVTLKKLWNSYSDEQLSFSEKRRFLIQESIKLLLSIAFIVFSIGLLVFPPTAVPTLTIIMAICITQLIYSVSLNIYEKRKSLQQAIPKTGPALMPHQMGSQYLSLAKPAISTPRSHLGVSMVTSSNYSNTPSLSHQNPSATP